MKKGAEMKRRKFGIKTGEPIGMALRKCPDLFFVMDNLNTHSIASLYETFPPDEALRLTKKSEL